MSELNYSQVGVLSLIRPPSADDIKGGLLLYFLKFISDLILCFLYCYFSLLLGTIVFVPYRRRIYRMYATQLACMLRTLCACMLHTLHAYYAPYPPQERNLRSPLIVRHIRPNP